MGGYTGNHRSRGVARKAVEDVVVANAVDDAVEAEPEAPPPPPPFNPADEVGVTAPLGFFDPLGFSKVGDKEGFRTLRLAEIKHARVAMMAAVGAVFQCLVHLPGFEKVPDGIGAVTSGGNGTIGFAALFVISGVLELVFWKQDPNKQVGDFGNPLQPGAPLGYNTDMRNFELNNGRFSMFAAWHHCSRDGLRQNGHCSDWFLSRGEVTRGVLIFQQCSKTMRQHACRPFLPA